MPGLVDLPAGGAERSLVTAGRVRRCMKLGARFPTALHFVRNGTVRWASEACEAKQFIDGDRSRNVEENRRLEKMYCTDQ